MNKKWFPRHKWLHQLDYISLINKDEKYYCFGACSTKSGLEYFFKFVWWKFFSSWLGHQLFWIFFRICVMSRHFYYSIIFTDILILLFYNTFTYISKSAVVLYFFISFYLLLGVIIMIIWRILNGVFSRSYLKRLLTIFLVVSSIIVLATMSNHGAKRRYRCNSHF